MSKIAFILGAGASVHCGAPLMGDFLDVANDLFWRGRVSKQKESFECIFDVIGKMQAVHSKAQLDLKNIEAIFTALELGKVIKRVVPEITKPKDIEKRIVALKEVIVATLEKTISFPIIGETVGTSFQKWEEPKVVAPRQYRKFADMVKLLRNAKHARDSTIITFNYDIALDFALSEKSLGPNYVVDSNPNLDESEQVKLLKLHGSLNWASEGSRKHSVKRIIPLHVDEYVTRYVKSSSSQKIGETTTFSVGARLQNHFESLPQPISVDASPVIVPPSWNKADYHHALSDVWSAAADALSEAEYIFVIGYSLPDTDSFFKHLYALGSVGHAPLKKFAVFNPDKLGGATDRRFQALLGPGALQRYEYHEMILDESISMISNMFDVKPSDDFPDHFFKIL
jgi:hypothetical protein